MMWWCRRHWLLLTAVFLLRTADGLVVRNKRVPLSLYGATVSGSVAQHQGVHDLPYVTKTAGSAPSVAGMQSRSVLPQQVSDPSWTQVVQSSCGSSDQMVLPGSETASGSAGIYQSVFQSGQQVPGHVTQAQLPGSSGNVETHFQGQGSKSVLGNPQVSSNLFQQGALHQGSSDSLATVSSAQGFPSWSTGSKGHATSVQSAPNNQGVYWTLTSGQSTYLPPENPQPPTHVPSQPQSYPQFLLPSDSQTVGVSASTSQQGSSGGQYQSSSWSASPVMKSRLLLLSSPSSPMHSSVTSTSPQSAQVGGSTSHVAYPSQVASTQLTSSLQSAQVGGSTSHIAYPSQVASTQLTSSLQSAPGISSTSQQSGDVPPKSSYYPPLYSQGGSTWQTSNQNQAQMQSSGVGSGLTSTSQQSASSSYGTQPSWPVLQPAHSQMHSVGVTSPTRWSASDAAQSGSNNVLPSQVVSTWQTSSFQSALQTAQAQMKGSSVGSGVTTATSQQSSSDVPQNGGYGSLYSKGAGTWQVSSHNQPSVQTAQAQMEGSTVASVSSGFISAGQPSARDAVPQSSTTTYGAHPSQVASTWQTSSQNQASAQTQMEDSSVSACVTSTSQQSASDSAQGSNSYYGSLPSQATGTGQWSAHQALLHTAQKQGTPNQPGPHTASSNQHSPVAQIPSSGVSKGLVGGNSGQSGQDAVTWAVVKQPASAVAFGRDQQSSGVWLSTSGSPSSTSYSSSQDTPGPSSFQQIKSQLPSTQFSGMVRH
ncbi:uncharacterized protein LOC143512682 [Brachyhypopomus gauderio]|uniref:uncharacterized protein LOC143512682 n=1 Tax=Brachyhypopomus gauderio TaxID=698409 RepID=UPI004041AB01